ncbi:hypothetical protein AB1Y20_015790 [Prymnesium parvum]|uniref:Hexosyltransferase n=1 Tax=Prymnesium parvum TaxID=97485 RepID=A0AB34K176_PRYPA
MSLSPPARAARGADANLAPLASARAISFRCAGCGRPSRTASCDKLRPPPPPAPAPPPTRASCSSPITSPHLPLVIGVFSGPSDAMRRRRDGIRASWFQWEGVGRFARACFVVGGRGVPPPLRRALEEEQTRHGDVLLLDGVADDLVFHGYDSVGPLQIHKLHTWWRVASAMAAPGSRVSYIAKVDDDTFINLPALEATLMGFHCVQQLYYGAIGFAGYNAQTFTMCGFSYASSSRAFRAYKCADRGAEPPLPFAMGAIVVLSSPLASLVAHSPSAARMANESTRGSFRNLGNEDVALGFWLRKQGEIAKETPRLNVTYVRDNRNIPNLGCYRNGSLYRPPSQSAVAVHAVKTAMGMQYVWRVLHDHMVHDKKLCRRMTGDYRL